MGKHHTAGPKAGVRFPGPFGQEMSRIFRINKYPPLKRWDICSFNPCGFTYAIKSFWNHIMKWIKVRHKARIRYSLDPMDGFSRELCHAC